MASKSKVKRGPKGPPGPPGPKGDRGATGVNKYYVSCTAGKLISPVNGIYSTTNEILDVLLRIEQICIEIRDYTYQMLELHEHVHYSHWHGRTHYADEGVHVQDGTVFIPPFQDEASILIAEYQNHIDRDDNGLIYGYDFVISDNDPHKPMSLRSLDFIMENNGDPIPSSKMSWSSYISYIYRR